ncbi:UDP-N-acetylglucosamine 2-epimerase (non-hydrolysing) [Lutibacter oricola]|uniref:UDP-N-acetylglucosamine 2-epimerase (Non-hydrolysing) n=1 Tax=Lutibacter oricola TaxID=762486 RepID=A0A1H2WZR4_9FLAO|nr:UDP-N-acetylglucosamine 2-epimerase (non-hydrolyzing) [Lutibacter oricola]SDW86037.1 UDP-N-acetylglucosamine 2-epimerase (non-hydrolysing) [Lutibacter oricola]
MKLTIVAGARPNFIKIAPIIKAIKLSNRLDYRLIHTGQHYDDKMSKIFFEQLEIPTPDCNLKVGSGSQAEQTAKIMISFENELLNYKTDIVIVVGDVNSTMACAIVAKKMNIKVAHVEGGIRSNDSTMPEEINRIVTDSITDYFFTTSKTANRNLIVSGVKKSSIFFVGNTMIDTLLEFKDKFIKPIFWDDLKLKKQSYILLTLHRPANVDEEYKLKNFISEIIKNSRNCKIIFPVHPRTKKIIESLDVNDSNLVQLEPLSYLEFNYLTKNAKIVITDSGGITEETTVMGIPCITLRDNTERPETVTLGTNELIGTNPKSIKQALDKLFNNKWKKGSIPELWDGLTSKRIIDVLLKLEKDICL